MKKENKPQETSKMAMKSKVLHDSESAEGTIDEYRVELVTNGYIILFVKNGHT